ncbi:MAG: NAD(P)-binding protein, partial [Flavobacteriaceae bacterium]|nr:NAD(P)-binding protein [Flavobacteriaceae bacterium]
MKSEKDHSIYIIGAGISGLIAAKVLEQHGYKPTIIEATDRVGGRVKTDIIEGYRLDHGFQVLLTSYPAIQNHLNLDTLQLHKLLPGASILKEGKQKILGDPLRHFPFLLPTLFSGIGNTKDRWKILKLQTTLKHKTIDEIFSEPERTTRSYLVAYGFSEEIIEEFFEPFFSGIFLEPHLSTSSRMFEFIYKMFGEGYAAIPEDGIEAIPRQIAKTLQRTTFLFNTKVSEVQENEIHFDNGERLATDFTIIATEASELVSNLKEQKLDWKTCDTLYFEVDQRAIDKRLIGLISEKNALINSIFYPSCIPSPYSPQQELLSVTIVKENHLSESSLIDKVKEELLVHASIENPRFLKRYRIPRALPDLQNVQYEMAPSETQLNNRVFLAGDV